MTFGIMILRTSTYVCVNGQKTKIQGWYHQDMFILYRFSRGGFGKDLSQMSSSLVDKTARHPKQCIYYVGQLFAAGYPAALVSLHFLSSFM